MQRIVLVMLISMGMGPYLAIPATPESFDCPVTEPVESRPASSADPFTSDASLYYEDGLWVTLPEDGRISLSPDDVITFGPLEGWRSTKVTWLREDGVDGFVHVSGRRLDADSDLTPQTPLSPQRQYVRIGQVTTGLAFPSEGCWEVTGSVSDHSITFVVEVRFDDVIMATPAISTTGCTKSCFSR